MPIGSWGIEINANSIGKVKAIPTSVGLGRERWSNLPLSTSAFFFQQIMDLPLLIAIGLCLVIAAALVVLGFQKKTPPVAVENENENENAGVNNRQVVI